MRLIDVDALLDDCIFTSKGLEMFVKEFLDDAPTIDAVPVVRCKDCKYFCPDDKACNIFYSVQAEDDYCSSGERKDG